GEAANQHEFAGRQHRGWRAWEEGPTSRHSLYRSLWQLLQPLPETARREILDELAAWSGAGPQDGADHRPLTIEEVIALAKGPLFEVGSHTITHPVLSALPADSQRDEIRQSKAELEEILGDRVTSFAYPYGGKSNYTDETIAIVCEAGFTSACSTLAKVVERGADRFQLPRLQVNDSNGEEFYRWLNLIQTAG
ncbi:MAG TPA: polysaccharide deacetylase family protein, partial [Blastocatellia bacterium]|nr:polysaccharide deacetylase family protein [Blastocatellia bacterium]